MPSFADAIAVKALDSHSYSAHFSEQWCIGTGELSLPLICAPEIQKLMNRPPQSLTAAS